MSQFPPSESPKGSKKPVAAEETSLQIVLRDGEKASSAGEPRSFVEGDPLSDQRAQELRSMFGDSLSSPKERPEFLKRDSSKPVPRATQVKELAFPTPAPARPPEVGTTTLEVSSVSPEGEVGRAPRVSISFTSPMIAVSDPERVERGDPLGIKIQPRPAGKWRWLGTQTLVFEPEAGEFPRATEYEVTVPAGVADIQGTTLSEAVTHTDSERSWWSWYDHENLRDERVEVFSQRLSAGVRTYTYTALATTPGEYVLPPLKAEEMYSPEVYGRTASGKLVVD